MRTAAILFFLGFLMMALWGCPTKPPVPQVQLLEETPGYLGRVPPAGLRIMFFRMLA